ncbi:hypothetical protein OE88DRAFT_1728281 [Heliocybe sulcata]|uniref:Uncharacterized protein n=1 Tax=Heliocybe sulcata TaxID=5364 RepID=A0A5C3MTW5_9AGAM|nr:hypothetical protein OE88DRAFT_1728281 [Heliocybe sulcata]
MPARRSFNLVVRSVNLVRIRKGLRQVRAPTHPPAPIESPSISRLLLPPLLGLSHHPFNHWPQQSAPLGQFVPANPFLNPLRQSQSTLSGTLLIHCKRSARLSISRFPNSCHTVSKRSPRAACSPPAPVTKSRRRVSQVSERPVETVKEQCTPRAQRAAKRQKAADKLDAPVTTRHSELKRSRSTISNNKSDSEVDRNRKRRRLAPTLLADNSNVARLEAPEDATQQAIVVDAAYVFVISEEHILPHLFIRSNIENHTISSINHGSVDAIQPTEGATFATAIVVPSDATPALSEESHDACVNASAVADESSVSTVDSNEVQQEQSAPAAQQAHAATAIELGSSVSDPVAAPGSEQLDAEAFISAWTIQPCPQLDDTSAPTIPHCTGSISAEAAASSAPQENILLRPFIASPAPVITPSRLGHLESIWSVTFPELQVTDTQGELWEIVVARGTRDETAEVAEADLYAGWTDRPCARAPFVPCFGGAQNTHCLYCGCQRGAAPEEGPYCACVGCAVNRAHMGSVVPHASAYTVTDCQENSVSYDWSQGSGYEFACPPALHEQEDEMVEVPIPVLPVQDVQDMPGRQVQVVAEDGQMQIQMPEEQGASPMQADARQARQQQPAPQHRARESGLWRSMCRERVDVLARHYGYSTIQSVVSTQAARYYARHPQARPIKHSNPTESKDNPVPSSSTPAVADEEPQAEFRNYTVDNLLGEDGDVEMSDGDEDGDASASWDSDIDSDDDAEWDLDDDDVDMGDESAAPPTPQLEPPASLPIPSPTYQPTAPTPAPSLPIPAPAHPQDNLHLNLPLTFGLDAVDLPRLADVPLSYMSRDEDRHIGKGTPPDRGRKGEWASPPAPMLGALGFSASSGAGAEWLDPALRAYPSSFGYPAAEPFATAPEVMDFDVGMAMSEWVPSPPTWPLSPTFTPLVVGASSVAEGSTLSRALG